MGRSRRPAFTLVETLVVVGIVAILAGLLVAALARARAQANVVRCAATLRQLNVSLELYGHTFNGYCLPALGGDAGLFRHAWYGTDLLGATMGLHPLGENGSQNEAVVECIARAALDCPANARDLDASRGGDYAYNTNLGDFRAYDIADAQHAAFQTWARFKKRSDVPGGVLVALDSVADVIVDDDFRFATCADLVTPAAGRPIPIAGRVHRVGSTFGANCLFHDGSVHFVASPAVLLKPWMIECPRPGDDAATLATLRWTRGRELPF